MTREELLATGETGRVRCVPLIRMVGQFLGYIHDNFPLVIRHFQKNLQQCARNTIKAILTAKLVNQRVGFLDKHFAFSGAQPLFRSTKRTANLGNVDVAQFATPRFELRVGGLRNVDSFAELLLA